MRIFGFFLSQNQLALSMVLKPMMNGCSLRPIVFRFIFGLIGTYAATISLLITCSNT